MRIRSLVRSFLVLFVAAAALAAISHFLPTDLEGHAAVADGDTITVDGERVRLSGLDAPEFGQTCAGSAGQVACGRAARRHLADLIDGEPVACKTSGRDRYDRLLAECFAGGDSLNARMVADGWAVSDGAYPAEEAAARTSRKGLWATKFDDPRDWREDHPREIGQGVSAETITARARSAISAIAKWLRALFA